MAIVIFGANGFIGRNLVHDLSKRGDEIIALSRNFDQPFFDKYKNCKCFEVDFRSPESYKNYLKKDDTVVHLVYMGIPHQANQLKTRDIENNLIPSVKLIEVCAQKNIHRFIYASSGGAVYGNTTEKIICENHERNPVNSYGITRLATEKYLSSIAEENAMDYTILRISNPYGRFSKPNAPVGIFNRIETCLLNDVPFELRMPLETTRDYINVEDVSKAFLKVIHYPKEINDTFNVSSGQGTSIQEIIELMERKYSKKLKVHIVKNENPEVLVNILDNTKIKNLT